MGTLTPPEIKAMQLAHYNRRPSNLDVQALVIWIDAKDRLQRDYDLAVAHEAAQAGPVFIPEKALNVPQPPPVDHAAYLEGRVQELHDLIADGADLTGRDRTNYSRRTAAFRHAIRDYCFRNGIDVPHEARVIPQKDRVA